MSHPASTHDEQADAWQEHPGALCGVRVLDLTRVLAGPFASMTLADLGADVIKIENPVGGDDTRRWGPPFQADHAAYFHAVNRNKRSLALDLKSAAVWRSRCAWPTRQRCSWRTSGPARRSGSA